MLEEPAGRLLGILVRAANVRDIVEIGTGRAVSTLRLAQAVHTTSDRMVSIDTDADAQQHAAQRLAHAGLADRVTPTEADGGKYLAGPPRRER